MPERQLNNREETELEGEWNEDGTVRHIPFKLTHLDQLKPEAAKSVYEILAKVLARERAKAASEKLAQSAEEKT